MATLTCMTCHGLYSSSEDKPERIQGRRCTCDPAKRPDYSSGLPTPVWDLDASDWESIKQAVSESSWIPLEYTRNDWVADVCHYLRHGGTLATKRA